MQSFKKNILNYFDYTKVITKFASNNLNKNKKLFITINYYSYNFNKISGNILYPKYADVQP